MVGTAEASAKRQNKQQQKTQVMRDNIITRGKARPSSDSIYGTPQVTEIKNTYTYIYTSTCTYDINTWHIHMTYTYIYIYIWVDPGHASAWAHFLLRCQHHPAARGACKPSSSWARTLSSLLVRMMRVLVTTITMRTMMLILGRIIFLPGMYTVGSTNLVHMHAWWASSSFVHIHVA